MAAILFQTLLPILVKLLIQLGMGILAKLFPGLTDAQKQVLQTHADEVRASKKKACEGIACSMQLVKE